jgi:AcrR family transcriptional regulator
MKNAIDTPSVAERIAAATQTRRQRPDYAAEVKALLAAARLVIARTGRARVSDIVAEAGLSNDAFYRHFPSKDDLVAALSEETAELIAAAIGRRMADEGTPEGAVACWVRGLLAQAGDKAKANLAVLDASSNLNTGIATGNHVVRAPLARLLEAPFTELGSPDPVLDAELVTHAVSNRVAGHLWNGTTPSKAETEYLTRFCLATARHAKEHA